MFESWSGRHKFKDLRSAIAGRFLFARVLPGLFYGLWRCIQRRPNGRFSRKRSFKSLKYEHFDRLLTATSGHCVAERHGKVNCRACRNKVYGTPFLTHGRHALPGIGTDPLVPILRPAYNRQRKHPSRRRFRSCPSQLQRNSGARRSPLITWVRIKTMDARRRETGWLSFLYSKIEAKTQPFHATKNVAKLGSYYYE